MPHNTEMPPQDNAEEFDAMPPMDEAQEQGRYAAFADKHPLVSTALEAGGAAVADAALSAAGDRIGVSLSNPDRPNLTPDEVPGVSSLRETLGEDSRLARVVGWIGSKIMEKNTAGGNDIVLPSFEQALRRSEVSKTAGQVLLSRAVSFGVGVAGEVIAAKKGKGKQETYDLAA